MVDILVAYLNMQPLTRPPHLNVYRVIIACPSRFLKSRIRKFEATDEKMKKQWLKDKKSARIV